MRRLVLVFLLLPLFALVPVARADAAALPGGKANYVVSLASLKAGDARDNWVRLGSYAFAVDGTVRAKTYLWWQRAPVGRQGTGATPDSSCSTKKLAVGQTLVRECQVLTAAGFVAGSTETRTGKYTVTGGLLHITWTIGQTWTEQWNVVGSSDGKLARLDYRSNTLATSGYAYGSNASLSTRRAMETVAAYAGTLKHDYVTWAHDVVTSSPAAGGAFDLPKFRTCATMTWCLTYLQPNADKACQASGGCVGTGGGSPIDDRSLQNYLVQVSGQDRRDTHWHWCTCLTRNANGTDREACYTGNSHVKPMLQIIDDSGAFRGWVGVEASFYPGKDLEDPRESDMLGAFRVTDFR
ncbi:hypothetical protein OG394_24015 [Kribbella sp. NBC_01245]|uniref:hypothetical protein n=1 Tax=Kribbella sp. NBC_01245 TaxID=2903578 RepID=UPI002E2C7740|nr:hypothetical protein [Kribbella sp. NBC_01245]